MNTIIENRRSVRKYKPGMPVSGKQLEQLLAAAMHAPSARNTRPWEFIAITKRDVLDHLPKIHPYASMCKTAGAAIIVVACPPSELPVGYFAQDCAAATQNILLEAVSMGLGTCWCGVYPMEERVAALREYFKIPLPKIPFNLIAVGVPDETPAKRGFFDESKVTYIE
jgi:nitroreductase